MQSIKKISTHVGLKLVKQALQQKHKPKGAVQLCEILRNRSSLYISAATTNERYKAQQF